MTISAVIFDLGNVVNRWEPEKALLGLYETPQATIEAMQTLRFKQWVGDVLDSGADIEKSLVEMKTEDQARYKMLRTYMDNIHLAHEAAVDGTSNIIQKLANEGVRLFAITNAGIAAFEALQTNFPVLEMMEDVFVSAKEKLMKPHRAAFDALLLRNDLHAGECLFIDDAQANVDGAKAAGLHAVRFESAPQLEGYLTELGLLTQGAVA